MSLKKSLMQKGMQLMSDPRVMKMMSDERVMKAVMTAMAMPGKAQAFAKQQTENVARVMALATQDEVKDLQDHVRKLETELARMKRASERPAAEPKAPRAKKSSSSAS
jgi:cell division FtsZ-interacting protein ZapD